MEFTPHFIAPVTSLYLLLSMRVDYNVVKRVCFFISLRVLSWIVCQINSVTLYPALVELFFSIYLKFGVVLEKMQKIC